MLTYYIICISISLLPLNNAFIPASLIDNVFSKVDKIFLKTFDITGETVTHDDIIKYGVIQSIVEYFYNQTNGKKLIDLKKMTTDYYDLTKLYQDYYNVTICNLEADDLINLVLKPYVASVDLNPETKDMPYAHFDAETFINSNQRVINYTENINSALAAKNYSFALKLSGEVLHTIQDFYSHSNWVEMGETDINYSIGNANFSQLPIIEPSEATCLDNCNLTTINCGSLLSFIETLITIYNAISSSSQFQLFQCPLTYYKCDVNLINTSKKLISGYYGGQKLPNGTDYAKPNNTGKCSHGGMFDKTVNQIAKGGINKDSGYYIVSPHAILHKQASDLAIKHTKFFFETIRNRIGDREYAKYLNLDLTPAQVFNASQITTTCSALVNKISTSWIISYLILVFYMDLGFSFQA